MYCIVDRQLYRSFILLNYGRTLVHRTIDGDRCTSIGRIRREHGTTNMKDDARLIFEEVSGAQRLRFLS
jgi:hypothetical protein